MITLNYKSVFEQPFSSPGFLGSHSYKKHTTKCAKMRLNSNKLVMDVQDQTNIPQNMQTMFLPGDSCNLATLAR